ncbi:MAG TPA: rhomboid family intramembrane serine protease [Gemmataceae bacterium]|nr:rhomboid family intramembrane serine protease [Gemmataceae bacterium]
MGIYDRDYYREDQRWSNPLARSQGTVFLVLLYCFMFIGQIATWNNDGPNGGGLTQVMELDVNKVLSGEFWRLISYALVHQPWNPFHVLFTLGFLVWIGHQVEDLYGTKEYLAFFALTSFLGGVAYTIVAAFSAEPPVLLGPSGAVTSVLVLFALHYPTRRFFYFPIWVIVAFYALVDVAGLTGGHANPAAVAVHLAGAGFAFLYHSYTLRVLNWLPSGWGSGKSVRRVPRPKLRVQREKPEPEPAAATTSATVGAQAQAGGSGGSVNEHLEAKLDEVLAKVAKHGKESLTEPEREILLKASEIYKKRRQSS